MDPERAASIQRFQSEIVPMLYELYHSNHDVQLSPSGYDYSIQKKITGLKTYLCIVEFVHVSKEKFELIFHIRSPTNLSKRYEYNKFSEYNFNDSEWKTQVASDIQKVFPPNSPTPSEPVAGDRSYRLMSHDANLWSAIHRLTLVAERYIMMDRCI